MASVMNGQVLAVELASFGGTLAEGILTDDHPLCAQDLASGNEAISDTATAKPPAEGVGVLCAHEIISWPGALLLPFGFPSDEIIMRISVPP